MIENIIFNPFVQTIYWTSAAIKVIHRVYFLDVFKQMIQESIEEGEEPRKVVFTAWLLSVMAVFMPIVNTYSAYISIVQLYRDRKKRDQ